MRVRFAIFGANPFKNWCYMSNFPTEESDWESFTDLVINIKKETIISCDKEKFLGTGNNVKWQEMIF